MSSITLEEMELEALGQCCDDQENDVEIEEIDQDDVDDSETMGLLDQYQDDMSAAESMAIIMVNNLKSFEYMSFENEKENEDGVFKKAWDFIKRICQKIADAITGFFRWVGNFFKNLFSGGKGKLEPASAEELKEAEEKVVESFMEKAGKVAAGAVAVVGTAAKVASTIDFKVMAPSRHNALYDKIRDLSNKKANHITIVDRAASDYARNGKLSDDVIAGLQNANEDMRKHISAMKDFVDASAKTTLDEKTIRKFCEVAKTKDLRNYAKEISKLGHTDTLSVRKLLEIKEIFTKKVHPNGEPVNKAAQIFSGCLSIASMASSIMTKGVKTDMQFLSKAVQIQWSLSKAIKVIREVSGK